MEASKFGFDRSKSISLHKYDQTTAIVGSLGTYEIPSACRRYCYSAKKSSVSVVSNHKCYCLDESTELDQFVAGTQSFQSSRSCANSYELFTDNLQRGFSTLNLEPGYESDLSVHPHYCGSVEIGGVYKCGTGADINPLATIYGFTNFRIIDGTFFPLDEIALKINGQSVTAITGYSSTIDFNEVINFFVEYPSCQKPCFLSEDGNTCICTSIPIGITLSFGDGTELHLYLTELDTSGLDIPYSYNQSGTFDFRFTARNNLYLARTDIEARFTVNVDSGAIKVVPAYINSSATALGEDSNFKLTVFQGAEFDCRFNYGDDSPEGSHSYSTIDPFATVQHRFREAGSYSVTATCSNLEQSGDTSNNILVQEPIVGLLAPVEKSISYEDSYKHEWELIQGSHVTCKVYYGDHFVEERSTAPDPNNVGDGSFYFNDVTNKGIALLPVPSNENFGLYIVVVTCNNAVTTNVPVAITYLSFEIPIDAVQLSYLTDTPYSEESNLIPLSLAVSEGSNFFVSWVWNDIENHNIDQVEYCFEEDCKSR